VNDILLALPIPILWKDNSCIVQESGDL